MTDFTDVLAKTAAAGDALEAVIVASNAEEARLKAEIARLQSIIDGAPPPPPVGNWITGKPGDKVVVYGLPATVQCPARAGAFQYTAAGRYKFNVKTGETASANYGGRARSELSFGLSTKTDYHITGNMKFTPGDNEYNILWQLHSDSLTENPSFSLNYDDGRIKPQTSQGTSGTIVTHNSMPVTPGTEYFYELNMKLLPTGGTLMVALTPKGGTRFVIVNATGQKIGTGKQHYPKFGTYRQTAPSDFEIEHWSLVIA
jgi:hypothetical protein